MYGKKSRYVRSNASKAVIRQPSGLPDRLFVKLKDRILINFTSTTGNLTYSQIYGNGPQSVLVGTGGQPLAWDQWTALYSNYICHGSSIRLMPVQNNSASLGMTFCINPQFDGTGPGTSDQYKQSEQPYARRLMTSSYTNSSTRPLKHFMTTRKLLGVNKRHEEGADSFRALISTLPTAKWYWVVSAWTSDATSTNNCFAEFMLTYYVEFYGRTTLATS